MPFLQLTSRTMSSAGGAGGGKVDEFGPQSKAYAAYRPKYPAKLYDDLFAFLSDSKTARKFAVDIGTGSGQVAVPLSKQFDRVIGIDKSAKQLEHATKADNITYKEGGAYPLDAESGAVDLICAGQCAHWFDLEKFFAEVKRTLRNDASSPGTLAVMGYCMLSVSSPDDASALFDEHKKKMDSFWSPACDTRKRDSGFVDVDFPFRKVERHSYTSKRHMNTADFVGYLSTWSALHRYKDAHADTDADPVGKFERDLRAMVADEGVEIEQKFFLVLASDKE